MIAKLCRNGYFLVIPPLKLGDVLYRKMEVGSIMVKKILIMIMCLLLNTSLLFNIPIGIAEDGTNPEIEDEAGDVPFGFIDILSAWFYEDSEDPEYLFVAFELKNLQYRLLVTLYAIAWRFEGTEYIASLSTWGKNSNCICFAGTWDRNNPIMGTCDIEENIVAMKIPKKEIGNPGKGDVLQRPYAWSMFSLLAGFFVQYNIYWFIDIAPNSLYGKNYIIQY
jgi:hypothetical protein